MEAIARLFSLVAIPLMLINMLGGIVSGIWLAILGEWGLIGYGILAFVVSGFALGLAMAPGLIFAAPAAAMLEKGNKAGGYFFGFLSTRSGVTHAAGSGLAFCLGTILASE